MQIEPKIYQASKMAELYRTLPKQWLLMEILKKDKAGRATELKFWKSEKNKDKLYDFLMDKVEGWNFNSNFIIIYSDPDKECELF